MYLTDSPIETVNDDLLRRRSFAHRLAEYIKNYQNNECLTILNGAFSLAVTLRLELRHRNIPITHDLANRCLTS